VSGSAVNTQEVRFDGAKRDYQGLNTVSTSRGEALAEPHPFGDHCADPRLSVKIQAESTSGGQKAAARREPRPPELWPVFSEVRENFGVSGDSAPRSVLAAILRDRNLQAAGTHEGGLSERAGQRARELACVLTCGCLLCHCDDSEPKPLRLLRNP
jgi:hypothetical protein